MNDILMMFFYNVFCISVFVIFKLYKLKLIIMELRHHLGILIFLTLVCLTIFITTERINEFKWYAPIGAAIIIFTIFEAFLWTLILCFL